MANQAVGACRYSRRTASFWLTSAGETTRASHAVRARLITVATPRIRVARELVIMPPPGGGRTRPPRTRCRRQRTPRAAGPTARRRPEPWLARPRSPGWRRGARVREQATREVGAGYRSPAAQRPP